MRPNRRKALREGRDAVLAQLRGEPMPPCPYRKGTMHHGYWQHGADWAARHVQKIMEIGS